MDLSFLVKEEEEKINNFLGEKTNFFSPNISLGGLEKFLKLGFDLHFLPKLRVTEDKISSAWQQKPGKNFYQLIKKERLSINVNLLPGQWILIDKRKKPKKNYWWLAKDDILVAVLKKLGIDLKKHCQKIRAQSHEDDFLLPVLKENGFASRFSLTWQEVNEIIRPELAKFLKIEPGKIRLPRFIEWNFLANLFYPEWGQTSTWEWFSDRFDTGECLTGGSESLSILGWDPPDFWSTQLGFRFLIEI